MVNKNKRAGKPEINQMSKMQSDRRESKDPPKVSVPWGRSASECRPGLLIHQYFIVHGESCAADIYYSLSEEIKRLNEERTGIGEKPLRRPNYSSFNRYMHWFLILGLIERTDKREPAIYDFLQQKVFYRLTDKDKSEAIAWGDPLGAAHPEFR